VSWFRGDDDCYLFCPEHFALARNGQWDAVNKLLRDEKARRQSPKGKSMIHPTPGRTDIKQPEPVHDYGLTAADRMIAASLLSDAEIDALFDASTANVVSESPTSMGRKFARAIEAAVLARQSVPDDFVAQLQALEKEALAIIAAGSIAQSVPDDVAKDAARWTWWANNWLTAEDRFLPDAAYDAITKQQLDSAIDTAIAAVPLPPKEQP
jgi:hypothetical protein